jgi:hypothetical protein
MLLSLLVALTCFSQLESDLDKYYPKNALYKKLKVKTRTDSVASPADHHRKTEYDRLGRQTASYYIGDSVQSRYKYLRRADTLIRLHLSATNGIEGRLYQFEKFVYNKDGGIILYQSCSNNYGEDSNTSTCELSKFIYDAKGQLVTKLDYYNSGYGQHFSESMQLSESGMQPGRKYYYNYDSAGSLVLEKLAFGSAEIITTFFYNSAKRLIKKTSLQKEGLAGELSASNIRDTEMFKYEKGKIVVTRLQSYTASFSQVSNKEMNEYIFYPNGLLKIWNYKDGDNSLATLCYNIYRFY